MTFVIIYQQTLIVVQSTLINNISSIFRLPHSGAVFLYLVLTVKEKI